MSRLRIAVSLSFVLLVSVLPVDARSAPSRGCLASVGGIDLQTATIPDLTKAMASGKLTSLRLVDAYLARIRAYDQAGRFKPNSIRYVGPRARKVAAALDAERRAGKLRGPLHGIPVLLKDNVGTKDMPTTAGAIALARNVPKRDASLTARLRKAGAVILGKANLAEFANWVSLMAPNGYSSIAGQVNSAYDGSNPSGSSSGSAVAMSLSLAAATIGTETAGSIVSPASYAGLVGVKPSLGVVSRAGVIPLAPAWDTAGPITRSVVDAALILGAIAGEDPRDPITDDTVELLPRGRDYTRGLGPNSLRSARIGYDPVMLKLLYEPPENGPVFEQALIDLEKLGATIVPAPTIRLAEITSLGNLPAIPNQFKESLNRYLATEAGPRIPVRTLSDIVAYNEEHPEQYPYGQDLLQGSDATPGSAALTPIQSDPVTTATAATLEATFAAHDLDAIVGPGDYYSYHGAASGWASLTVPAGMIGEVPEGIMFIGRPFTDDKLLAYASAYERIGRPRVPPPTSINRALVAAACKKA
jgi:amidase